ncbi:hypothetical protein [Ideonella sp. BN130291]|uniref:hypothetical protein n=1 Tax=Ideonella sp. BN130291 TaxID=3112940 RepID=UPI002E276B34|nr:hypothetical protein [Ideonella sp. BN130291]
MYLGTRAIAVCRGNEVLLAEPVSGTEQGIERLAGWLGEAPARSRVKLWLSGGLCRPFVLPPVPGVRSKEELVQMATAMAPLHTGLDGGCTVWLENAALTASCVAVAVQSDVLAQWHGALAKIRPKPVTIAIRPWWNELLRASADAAPVPTGLAVCDCDSLTVLLGAGAAIERVVNVFPVVDETAADAALARVLLSADAATSQVPTARLRLDGVSSVQGAVALSPLLEWTR